MQQPPERITTFNDFQKDPNNKGKDFNDYLEAYFKLHAVPVIRKAIQDDSLALISRITNDLRSIHPELTDARVVDQFKTAVDMMTTEPQYKEAYLQRWFYGSVALITALFLDKEGRIKDRFLLTLIGEEIKGKKVASLEQAKALLYGDPPEQERIDRIAGYVVGSAGVAVSQIVSSDQEVHNDDKYRSRASGVPEDDIRLQRFSRELSVGKPFERLRDFIQQDFFLCRLQMLKQQRDFLSALNELLPSNQKISDFKADLDGLIDRIFIHGPVAGSEPYQHVYNIYMRHIESIETDMLKNNPGLQRTFDEFYQLSSRCFADMRNTTFNKNERIAILKTDYDHLLENARTDISRGPKP